MFLKWKVRLGNYEDEGLKNSYIVTKEGRFWRGSIYCDCYSLLRKCCSSPSRHITSLHRGSIAAREEVEQFELVTSSESSELYREYRKSN